MNTYFDDLYNEVYEYTYEEITGDRMCDGYIIEFAEDGDGVILTEATTKRKPIHKSKKNTIFNSSVKRKPKKKKVGNQDLILLAAKIAAVAAAFIGFAVLIRSRLKKYAEKMRKEGFDAGRSEGYAQGFKSGKDKGYKLGKKHGSSAGYRTGYDKGKTSGNAEGYGRGMKRGQEIGFNAGNEAGKKEGYKLGKKHGSAAGYRTGYWDGSIKGFDKGHEEGKREGFLVGRKRGLSRQKVESDKKTMDNIIIELRDTSKEAAKLGKKQKQLLRTIDNPAQSEEYKENCSKILGLKSSVKKKIYTAINIGEGVDVLVPQDLKSKIDDLDDVA